MLVGRRDEVARLLSMLDDLKRSNVQVLLGDAGIGKSALLDELRMEVAVKYLRDTELTVDDIAYSLGFSEATNFRRAFRRWTSRSPREFRDHEHSVRN